MAENQKIVQAGWRPVLAVLLLFLQSGCATHLTTARGYFYQGDYQKAEEELASTEVNKKDRVLFFMERGTIRQATGDYKKSAADFITAADNLKDLETYSLSKGAASLVINDNVQPFTGAPFERTLLHDLTALNHLAMGNWDNAAVESRKIIISLGEEERGNYPEDGFSRYIAGLGFEMIDDPSNAALQYRLADTLFSDLRISDTGLLSSNTGISTNSDEWPTELICVILLGRSPSGNEVMRNHGYYDLIRHAEIYADNQYLGRSFSLADTAKLAITTLQQQAVAKAVKTTSRIVLKEGIAHAVDQEYGPGWGALVRLIFIALLEQPDIRRWETLPRQLHIARVPCPPDLKEFDIMIKNQHGTILQKIKAANPLSRRGNIFFALYRDLPVQP